MVQAACLAFARLNVAQTKAATSCGSFRVLSAGMRDLSRPALLSSFSRRGATDSGPEKHTRHPRTNRAAATAVGAVSQHAAAADETAGVALAGCGRTSAAARCVSGGASAAAGLHATEEAARRSS